MSRLLIHKVFRDAPAIEMYADADWDYDDATRRSQSGCVIKVFGNTVMWQSSKQRCTSGSTLESEYISYEKAARNTLWINNLLTAILPKTKCLPAITWCDNQACLSSLRDEFSRSDRLRHIDISYRFVRELVQRGTFKVDYVSSGQNSADVMTKALGGNMVESATILLGMIRG